MISVENNIPVFTARGGSSVNTASICLHTMSARMGWMPMTARGFCAVMQVMAVRRAPERSKSFQVRLNTRAAAAVRAGDGEGDRQLVAFHKRQKIDQVVQGAGGSGLR